MSSITTYSSNPIVQKTAEFAVRSHRAVNHKYGEHDYERHLQIVVDFFHKYKYLLNESEWVIVEQVCWLHDVIEDCHKTYGDITKEFGVEVADLVYLLTDEKGKNRKERAARTYPALSRSKNAVFVKLCDRLANTSESVAQQSSMYWKYQEEFGYFKYMLYNKHHKFDEMWSDLETMSSQEDL